MELTKKRCVPCEGGVDPLITQEAQNYLKKSNTASKRAKIIYKTAYYQESSFNFFRNIVPTFLTVTLVIPQALAIST